jgi:hypothetical protein
MPSTQLQILLALIPLATKSHVPFKICIQL